MGSLVLYTVVCGSLAALEDIHVDQKVYHSPVQTPVQSRFYSFPALPSPMQPDVPVMGKCIRSAVYL